VKLSIAYPNRKEVILTVIEQGNWFGAGPVLQRRPRAHTATAIKNCEVFVVSAPKFDDLMNRPGFAGALARQMAERLRLAYASMGATALLSTREDGRSTISTSQDVLAMMLGISRPTINKELHALAKLGLISVRYGRIELSEAFDATDVVSRHF
jgi:CRP-like cAMP-binding protein